VAPKSIPSFIKIQDTSTRPGGLFGSAGRVANTLLGGWSVSTIINYFSGTPLGFSASSPLAGAWNGGANRPIIAPGDKRSGAFQKNRFEFSTPLSPNNTYLNKAIFSDVPPCRPEPHSASRTSDGSGPSTRISGCEKIHS
jgi:hypothetical protein